MRRNSGHSHLARCRGRVTSAAPTFYWRWRTLSSPLHLGVQILEAFLPPVSSDNPVASSRFN